MVGLLRRDGDSPEPWARRPFHYSGRDLCQALVSLTRIHDRVLGPPRFHVSESLAHLRNNEFRAVPQFELLLHPSVALLCKLYLDGDGAQSLLLLHPYVQLRRGEHYNNPEEEGKGELPDRKPLTIGSGRLVPGEEVLTVWSLFFLL